MTNPLLSAWTEEFALPPFAAITDEDFAPAFDVALDRARAAIAAIALIGLYLVAQQWDRFTHTFAAYSNWQGVLGIGLALSVAKIAHELGHAFAVYRHGCRVPQMGVACMVLLAVTLGRWLEANGKLRTTAALRELESLLPDQVRARAGGLLLPRSELPQLDVRAGLLIV